MDIVFPGHRGTSRHGSRVLALALAFVLTICAESNRESESGRGCLGGERPFGFKTIGYMIILTHEMCPAVSGGIYDLRNRVGGRRKDDQHSNASSITHVGSSLVMNCSQIEMKSGQNDCSFTSLR
jgi:hypothetical protein